MANRRSQNWLNQQRVDVPHLRSIESAVRNDFDELLSSFAIGEDQSYFIRGFEISMVGAVGSAASSLQLIVDGASLFHGKSNTSGTFFQVEEGAPNETLNSTTNTKVDGAFTPSSLNYVGIELKREVDSSTISQLFFWNPTNQTEFSKTTPLAQTLDYEIVITSTVWASNILPLAIVETDSSNAVLSVEDRRDLLFRLGTAGEQSPNPFYTYPWDNHAEGRTENPFASSSATSPFRGGDKQILHFKEWADAVMSQIKELKGTTYWYSFNQGGSILKLRGDVANTMMTGPGSIEHSDATGGLLNWNNDFHLTFVSSRLKYTIQANPTPGTDLQLNDNDVAYINIVRGQDITPKLVFTNGSAIVTSVGAVAWTADILVGDYIKVAAEDDTKYYKVQSIDSTSQVTLENNFQESSTGSLGALAQYAYGFYQVVAAPSTDRHVQIAQRELVPFNEDAYWLFLRDDNGGTAKIYIRGSGGGELEQGESRQISDNTTEEVLNYIGASGEADETPDYTNAVTTSVAEVTTYTLPAASALTSGQRFEFYSNDDLIKYHAYPIIDGAGTAPSVPGSIPVPFAINSADNAIAVGAAFHAAVNALADFNSVDNADGTVTVTNAEVGATTDAVNIDMGAGFSINVDTQGAGSANYALIDDENLTRGIKRVDQSLGQLAALVNSDTWKPPVANFAALPASGNQDGDVRLVLDTRVAYHYKASDSLWLPLTGGAGIKMIGGGTASVSNGTDLNGAIEQLLNTHSINNPNQNNYTAQTFTPSTDITVSAVELLFWGAGSPPVGTVTCEIWGTDGSSEPDETNILATSTPQDVTGIPDFVDDIRQFTLTSPITLSAGVTYAIVSNTDNMPGGFIRYRGNTGNPYAGGQVYNQTSPPTGPWNSPGGGAYDLWFRLLEEVENTDSVIEFTEDLFLEKPGLTYQDNTILQPTTATTNALETDGTAGNNGANVPYNATYHSQTNNISIFTKVQIDTLTPISPNSTIVAHGNSLGSGLKWFLQEHNGVFRVVISGSGSGVDKEYRTVAPVIPGQWYDIGFTFTTNTLKLYVDGVEVTGGDLNIISDTTVNTLFASTDPVAFNKGLAAGFERPIDGRTAQITYWDKELTAAEVAELYNNGKLTNPLAHSASANLIGLYTMEGDTTGGGVVTDTSGNGQDATIVGSGAIVTVSEPNTQAAIVLPNDKDVAYVEPNLIAGGSNLTVVVDTLDNVPPTAVIIARKDGSDVIIGSSSTRLAAGESIKLYDTVTDQAKDKQRGADYGFFRSADPVTWTGTALQFTQDIVFETINRNGTEQEYTIAQSASALPNIEQTVQTFVGMALIPNAFVAQTFTVPAGDTYNMLTLALKLNEISGPVTGTLSAQIWGVTGGGVPDNTNIIATSTNSLDVSTLPTTPSVGDFTFNFSGLNLTPGTQYCWVLEGDSYTGGNIGVGTDNSNTLPSEDLFAGVGAGDPGDWTPDSEDAYFVITGQTVAGNLEIPDGHWAYIEIDRTKQTETVNFQVANFVPAIPAAGKDIIVFGKRRNFTAGSGYLYLALNKQILEPGQTVRIGASGAGGGDANSFRDLLEDVMTDSTYEAVTPYIAELDQDDASLIDASSTGEYSLVDKRFKLTSIGQTLVSAQLLDPTFLADNSTLEKMRLVLKFDDDSTPDSGATFEASRNGGAEWQAITMEQVDESPVFSGSLDFAEESTQNTLTGDGAITGANLEMADTTTIAYAQPFTLANKTLVRKVFGNVQDIVGSVDGFIVAKIVADDGGSPSTDPDDIIFSSVPYSLNGISAGEIEFEVTPTVLLAGDYHVVYETDAVYKALYNNGVLEFSLGANDAGVGAQVFDGTTWTTVAGDFALTHRVEGFELDLRIRVTSSITDVLIEGFGALFDQELANVSYSTLVDGMTKVSFNAVADNLNEFTLPFIPNQLLVVRLLGSGQSFFYGDFSLAGNKVVFPEDQFNNGGVEKVQTLIFDNVRGETFDNSDTNASTLAANHLGGGAVDYAVPGRGIVLKSPDGTTYEITILDGGVGFDIFEVT